MSFKDYYEVLGVNRDASQGEKDRYGWYEQCLHCGYVRDPESKVEAQQHLAEGEKDKELARAV